MQFETRQLMNDLGIYMDKNQISILVRTGRAFLYLIKQHQLYDLYTTIAQQKNEYKPRYKNVLKFFV